MKVPTFLKYTDPLFATTITYPTQLAGEPFSFIPDVLALHNLPVLTTRPPRSSVCAGGESL